MNSETTQTQKASHHVQCYYHTVAVHMQSPDPTLIYVMRLAIFMLHLFTGNSSAVDSMPHGRVPLEPERVQ